MPEASLDQALVLWSLNGLRICKNSAMRLTLHFTSSNGAIGLLLSKPKAWSPDELQFISFDVTVRRLN
ncbi:hypothetical protein P608_24725 [Comamonas thiooxydans]|uniref:Uncharacterized protein n=1 Tax=Comamonas thiooxydans TaxID=363952 RepID=A0A0E3BNC4_9BURK|nr:hypothetical protein P369_13875 [Comamonas thiooxydans]KGG98244.1 hypothetical protein P367_13225 [Comamonas thiooxydans]KGH04199.1 hypothetical protein P608_24725 [Comamonas thiooxydans]KGH28222.1 hypothetical protein P607_02805 [Comamonas thiooxydans]